MDVFDSIYIDTSNTKYDGSTVVLGVWNDVSRRELGGSGGRATSLSAIRNARDGWPLFDSEADAAITPYDQHLARMRRKGMRSQW